MAHSSTWCGNAHRLGNFGRRSQAFFLAPSLICLISVIPFRCLLRYIDDEDLSTNVQTFLQIVLFYAKNTITMHWKSQSKPTIAFWLTIVNQAIPLYKLTFEAWGCPKKFTTIWIPWVSSDCTIPPARWFIKIHKLILCHHTRTQKVKMRLHVNVLY